MEMFVLCETLVSLDSDFIHLLVFPSSEVLFDSDLYSLIQGVMGSPQFYSY